MSTYRLKGASGAVAGQAFALGAHTVIGSAADCDLQIEQEGVAGRHVEILSTASGGLELRNLAAPGATRVNGKAVDQCPLASGDEIRLANCRWVLQAPGLRPEKLLTPEALRPKYPYLPWLLVTLLLAAAALAWQQGLLLF